MRGAAADSKSISDHLALPQVRGAARVILIDNVADRLSFAQSKIPGLEVIDFNKVRLCGKHSQTSPCFLHGINMRHAYKRAHVHGLEGQASGALAGFPITLQEKTLAQAELSVTLRKRTL